MEDNNNWKIFILFLIVIVIASFKYTTSKKKDSQISNNDLKPFNEVINAPDSYRITDYKYWTEDKPPTNVGQTKSSDISCFVKSIEQVGYINNIINNKELTPVLKEEYSIYDDDINKTTRFWLYSWIDSDIAKEFFHAYQIIIGKDKSVYILASKGNDRRFLKTSLTDEEFEYIENLYNDLMKEKVDEF